MLVYILTVELCTIAALTLGWWPQPTAQHWLGFALLLIGSTLHLEISRRSEERLRARHQGRHIDLASIWMLPAAITLPTPLFIAIVVLVRGQRYLIARKPLFRFTFTTVSVLAAGAAAGALARSIDLLAQLPNDYLSFSLAAGQLLCCGALYIIVQMVIIGGVVAISTQRPTLVDLLGSREDNLQEILTVWLGLIAAVLLCTGPLVLGISWVAIKLNQLSRLPQLEQAASTDGLTGLLNRATGEQELRTVLRRRNDTGALLLIDLDHFKGVNDTYGHIAGDAVLRAVADLLRERTRASDLRCRWGGEELMVFAQGVNREQARQMAEGLRAGVAALKVPITHRKGGTPMILEGRTATIGLSMAPEDAEDTDSLVRLADQALYTGKAGGRDRVVEVELEARGGPAHCGGLAE